MCVCLDTRTCLHTRTCIKCAHAYTFGICTHLSICICTCIYIWRVYTPIYMHMHMYIHLACVHTYVYTCAHVYTFRVCTHLSLNITYGLCEVRPGGTSLLHGNFPLLISLAFLFFFFQVRKVVEQACFTASVRLSASFGSAAVASAEVFFSFFLFPSLSGERGDRRSLLHGICPPLCLLWLRCCCHH